MSEASVLSRFAQEHRERLDRLWPVRRSIRPAQVAVPLLVQEPIPEPEPPAVPPQECVDITRSILTLRPVTVTLTEIMQIVCAVANVPFNEFKGTQRLQRVVRARHIFFYLARQLTSFSLDRIGHKCGNRDHSTVLHGIRKVEASLDKYADTISAAKKLLGVE